ncbi:Ankyrin repeat domain-containing protein 2 [Porphyridium purpureum]|uniref:Ankyrin repeat domain-containing protein 2 n=1 Tax=Porphyridium purpureum TaxID=35688 RepID=A0A5J4YR89_PORPP|nr:Ankyrin repeat domain-containing protein 2 [Porphyridium purpureum]|eukprot:POR0457..scf229_5
MAADARLIDAVIYKDLRAVEELLEQGANPSATDKFHCCTLSWAARGGKLDVIQLLLNKKADATIADKWGNTPLHEAASAGELAAAQLLLAAGVDTSATNKAGETALDVARSRKKRIPALEAALSAQSAS